MQFKEIKHLATYHVSDEFGLKKKQAENYIPIFGVGPTRICTNSKITNFITKWHL